MKNSSSEALAASRENQIQRVLEFMVEHKKAKREDICKALGTGRSVTRAYLHELQMRGQVSHNGRGSNAAWSIAVQMVESQEDPEGVYSIYEIAPGHRVVRIGRDWKPAPAQTYSPNRGFSSPIMAAF